MKNNEIEKAIIHLSEKDKTLKRIIKNSPYCNLIRNTKYFNALIQMIIGQQLSVNSARAIRKKFNMYFLNNPKPSEILSTDDLKLRSLGLSAAKTKYIKELSLAVEEKRLKFAGINKMSNEVIIEKLISIKGIGIWTAHMFLIFVLCRLDVLPYSDFGIRKSIMLNYGIKKLPVRKEVEKIATQNNWHPYESVAAWYLWKSLDSK
jgi:DNA-3-methyladenine glycosylase II